MKRLNLSVDAASLAAFRVAFGLLVSVSSARFLAYGWTDPLFAQASFHFEYWAFRWVPHLPAQLTQPVFVVLILLGGMVAAGAFYRVSIVALFLLFSWLQLADVANYLNHYYLVSLLALLLSVMPAHRLWSFDAWRNPALRAQTVPAWCLALLRFQVGAVYVFAGLAKLNGDWLLEGQPLHIWLSARASLPLVGPWLQTREAAQLASWAGFLFDSTVPLFLSLRKTRAVAYAAVLVFHAATWALFPIGMFPFIMVVSALVFFDPSWPRRFLKGPAPQPTTGPGLPRWAWAAGFTWCALQLALPLRAYAYGGNVSWHEQGMRFSWRVMTREKNGSVTFVVTQPATGREWHVSPRRYLTPLQEREMSVQPDLILQLAQHIGAEWNAKGLGPVEVHADAIASLNGRSPMALVDPGVDLMKERDGLLRKQWIATGPK